MKNWLIVGMGLTLVSSASGMHDRYEKVDGEQYRIRTLSIPDGSKYKYYDQTTTQDISKIVEGGRESYTMEESIRGWEAPGSNFMWTKRGEPVARSQQDLETLFNHAAGLYAKQQAGQLEKEVLVSTVPGEGVKMREVRVVKSPIEQYTLITSMDDGGYKRSSIQKRNELLPTYKYTVDTYDKNGVLTSSENPEIGHEDAKKKFKEFKDAYELQEALT